MSDTPNIPPIIAEALAWLPPSVRADFAGAAFIKLQSLAGDLPRAEQVRAIATHIRTQYRREVRSRALDAAAHERPAATVDDAELADTLAAMDPRDRGIVAMILAGNTRREAAAALALSPATLCRRIQRLRRRWRD
jgi:hypothetical protein